MNNVSQLNWSYFDINFSGLFCGAHQHILQQNITTGKNDIAAFVKGNQRKTVKLVVIKLFNLYKTKFLICNLFN